MATKPEKNDPAAPENTTGADTFGDEAQQAQAKTSGAQQYKVLIAGISRPGQAPAFQGEIVDGDTLGDAKRIAKLLELGRIEAI